MWNEPKEDNNQKAINIDEKGIPVSILEQMPGGYHCCEDNEQNGYPLVYVSNRFLEIVGWTRTEIQEKFHNRFLAMIHPDDLKIRLRYHANNQDDEEFQNEDFVYRILGKDGYHWVTGGANEVILDGKRYIHGTVSDITYYMEKKEKYKKDQRDRMKIIQSLGEIYSSMYYIDIDANNFIELSSVPEVQEIIGVSGNARERMKYFCSHLVAPEFQEEMMTFTDLSTLGDRLKETRIVTKQYRSTLFTILEREQEECWRQCCFIESSRNDEGRVTHVIFTTQSIHDTKIRELETQERLQKANKAKTDFLFNMSHDIRTPMNAIIGFTDLLEKHLDEREKVLSYIDKIKTSNGFLLSLINNVLEMARIESGKEYLDEMKQNAVEFSSSLFSLFDPQMKEKGITFHSSVQVEHPDVLVDETKVKEIFLNIMSNAVKYTPQGGTITMNLTELPSDRPGYAIYQSVIQDTGIGMSEDFQPHIFEEFTRERSTTESRIVGTGLGMPIVKKLVDLMQGTIEVESKLGKGTKFIVTLPHRIAEKIDVEQFDNSIQEYDRADFTGRRILLAEDNALNAEIAITILEEAGFMLEHAEDGIICVDMIEKAKAGYYDLVLMDIQMPNMDGYKATQAIRRLPDEKKASIPIIAMTANAFEEDRRNAFRVGMNGHIAKPICVDSLLSLLSEMLKK